MDAIKKLKLIDGLFYIVSLICASPHLLKFIVTMAAVRPSASTCQVCFHPGHCYRNCAHPTIEALHVQGIEIYKRFMLAHNNQVHYNNMHHWTAQLSRGMMRALITRYALPQVLFQFDSIHAWRTWRTARAYSDSIYIPARPAIQGAATLEELRCMTEVVYTALAKEVILVDVDSAETMAASDHVEQMRAAFSAFRSDLSRNPNVSGQGLQNYAQDIIRYLETIVQQQEAVRLVPRIPVPMLQAAYLSPPTLPLVYIPMPRPVVVVDVAEEEEEDDGMFVGDFVPLRNTRREPTFTIDLRLSPPPVVADAAADPDADAGAEEEEEPIQCGICWDEVDDERRVVTNCNHNYCDGCITSQLDSIRVKHRRSGDVCRYLDLSCALCRQNVHTLSHNIADNAKIHAVKSVLYHPAAVAPAVVAVADAVVV